MRTVHNWYESRPKHYVGCFLSKMLNWMWTFYNELRSILLLGEIERVQWKTINGKELQMMNQVESFDYFLNEGKKYLSMAYDLHEFNEKSSKLLPRVLKALDAYTRLNAFCKSTNLWDVSVLYQYEDFLEKPVSKYEHNEEIVEDENEHDGEIMKDEEKRDKEIKHDKNKYNKRIRKNQNRRLKDIVAEKKEHDVTKYDDIIFMFREREQKDSDQYDDCYADILLTKDYRAITFLRQLLNIKTLIAQLQDLYDAFNRHRLSLYFLLADYCLKAGSFLRRNTQFRNSRKLRRDKERSMRHKYRHLEQLIARIIEERKYMAKYIETSGDCHRPEANAKWKA